jgi:hypothetical protein
MNIYPHRSADSFLWEGKTMWKTLRLYWIAARGYRLRPWSSPYLQWRFETFLGKEAANMTAKKFFQLSWKYRDQLRRFADWSAERRRVRHHHA